MICVDEDLIQYTATSLGLKGSKGLAGPDIYVLNPCSCFDGELENQTVIYTAYYNSAVLSRILKWPGNYFCF